MRRKYTKNYQTHKFRYNFINKRLFLIVRNGNKTY